MVQDTLVELHWGLQPVTTILGTALTVIFFAWSELSINHFLVDPSKETLLFSNLDWHYAIRNSNLFFQQPKTFCHPLGAILILWISRQVIKPKDVKPLGVYFPSVIGYTGGWYNTVTVIAIIYRSHICKYIKFKILTTLIKLYIDDKYLHQCNICQTGDSQGTFFVF